MLAEAFAAQAAAHPGRARGADLGGVAELRRAGGAGHAAPRRGCGPGGVGRDELVGLIMRRGPEQIVGILAALLAGGAYLPVDAAPARRADRLHAGRRPGRAACSPTPAGSRHGDGDRGGSGARRGGPAGARCRRTRPGQAPGAGPDDLAYVLYTSGTTGEPKGVMVSHRSVANVVADCNARFGIGPADRFFGVSAFNFDLSVYDIVRRAVGRRRDGAARRGPGRRPGALARAVRAGSASRCGTRCPPSPALLAEHGRRPSGGAIALAALRLVMMSGDRIPPALPADAAPGSRPGLTLMSLGGPTETTIWNISHPIGAAQDGGSAHPLRPPNANNRAYILDADGLDAPDWVTGEICAAGTGPGPRLLGRRGAHGRAVLAATSGRGERLYRTGDLGRYLPDGSIDDRRAQRLPDQGQRLPDRGRRGGDPAGRDRRGQAGRRGPPGRRRTATGWSPTWSPAGDDRPADEAIRRQLREHLPDYMTPSAIVLARQPAADPQRQGGPGQAGEPRAGRPAAARGDGSRIAPGSAPDRAGAGRAVGRGAAARPGRDRRRTPTSTTSAATRSPPRGS